jgi:hypothetical protein
MCELQIIGGHKANLNNPNTCESRSDPCLTELPQLTRFPHRSRGVQGTFQGGLGGIWRGPQIEISSLKGISILYRKLVFAHLR